MYREENFLLGFNIDMISELGDNGLMLFIVYCLVICSDMIEYFKVYEIMNCELVFIVVIERGNKEEGVGVERSIFIFLEVIF